MKISIVTVSLIAIVLTIGCSKNDGGSASKTKRIVPGTAAEVAASSDYKIELTTKGGIQCYVRPLSPEIANTISLESPDQEFLNGGDSEEPYFLVLVRDGKIIDKEAAYDHPMSSADNGEIMGLMMKRNKKMQQMLKEAGKK